MSFDADQVKMLGASSAFMALVDQVSKVAPLNRPVLVIGERGSGKELIAARIHFLSQRWNRAYEKLNCAALPSNLLESELFGYEQGAFTGANRTHQGRFERAHEGSLFLDEVASMADAAQEKLLRVIEYGEFERLGGSKPLRVDVRVIAAANVDLPQWVEEGRFRADLLDRLSFDVLTLPPLRARKGDLALLVQHFSHVMGIELGWADAPSFSDKAMQAMLDYDWPGNIRELKNVVERAVYRWDEADGPIDSLTFDPFDSPWRPLETKGRSVTTDAAKRPVPPEAEGAHLPLRERVALFEKTILQEALRENRYNKRATAQALGLSYDQLRHDMKRHGLH